jgi:hypothetical protein
MKPIELKKKATFNLSSNALESLECICFQLKRQLKNNQRITKTALIETALEICLGDFDAKREKSALYKRLARRKNDNSVT